MDSKNNAMGNTTEFFPDGTVIPEWYYDTTIPTVNDLGKQYFITDYGALDDGRIHTKEIQNAIDDAAKTGGVVVVPAGVYYTGAIYFKPGVNLYLSQGATLKGSDNITDYDLNMTRMEGETCLYFGALINGDGLDGFTILGPGTIDGNGLRSWQSFWLRRKWNRMCTNKDEQRPRLVYITNSKNLLFANVTLQNSHYWTTHLYRCHHVKYLGCRILSPAGPVFAPSTDAIDLDVCSDVLVKNCYLGEGMDTQGSNLIIAAADKNDPRPLWILLWGGALDLAQAVWRVSHDRTSKEAAAFRKKLRIYSIGDQYDDTGKWMKDMFPDLFYITNYAAFRGMYRFGDTSLSSFAWVQEHVKKNGSALGTLYPDYSGGDPWGDVNGLKEGDTPSVLYIISKQPHNLDDPIQSSWGGQFQKVGPRRYQDVPEGWQPSNDANEIEKYAETIAKWRADYQADFAKRLQWCVK